jgi:hypothetical protein
VFNQNLTNKLTNEVNVKGVPSVYHQPVNIRSGDRILSTLSINAEHVSLFIVTVKTMFSN